MSTKKFDVRSEMLSKPDEWVGAYKSVAGIWMKVGFDFNRMLTVEAPFSHKNVKVVWGKPGVYSFKMRNLKICIPIEDVPAEELK